MRVLGIDPSLSATGWCVLDDDPEGGVQIVDWGVWKHKMPPKATLEQQAERLEWFWWRFNEVRMKLSPQLVAIEGDILGTMNPRTTVALAQLGGVFRLQIAFAHLQVEEWGHSQWKLRLFGKGKGGIKKPQVLQLLASEYGLEIPTNLHDQAEAFCVALAAWEKHHESPG